METSDIVYYEHEHNKEGNEEIILWAGGIHIGNILIEGSFG